MLPLFVEQAEAVVPESARAWLQQDSLGPPHGRHYPYGDDEPVLPGRILDNARPSENEEDAVDYNPSALS